MTRATIAGIAVAAVLGAGVLTAVTMPALSGGRQSAATWQGSMPARMQNPEMMDGTSYMGMMGVGGRDWTGSAMHNGLMRGWSR